MPIAPSPGPVVVSRQAVVLPTYEPATPDRNPMFLESRVYQGSSGRVYPLPFYDRIAEQPAPRTWDAIYLENEFLRVMILPELGGRIHRLLDKTNGYDVIYYQPVIKPALVGLAGPWISGGIEFNWPQHHRPSTFMPADVQIESSADGSVTVWLGEHDPMARMKGMHGVCLHPGRALLEVKARVYNRTADVQTFLWWANVATRVHQHYQSFFPPDATYVADHAKRAMSTFPRCTGDYYGVDYAGRARDGVPAAESPRKYVPPGNYPANDLSWYANIPVPTSYMCMGSQEDFFGGYDHAAEAGIVHVADHHIAPGKKQWTWGNHEFGYAWDRNLTDADANGEHRPYIELMAGVFTDNQPDFSFLQPGETKAWSQYWYPIQKIGPAQRANTDAAISFQVRRNVAHVAVAVTATQSAVQMRLLHRGKILSSWSGHLAPDRPLLQEIPLSRRFPATDLTVRVTTAGGRELISYSPARRKRLTPAALAKQAATEPPAPAETANSDELYLTGLHLEQYRHATRSPALYWREALRHDPGDARCNLALGRWHLRRGEFVAAEGLLRAALARLTHRNPNPADGEAHYQLGVCLRHLGRDPEAYDAFFKATWNQAWQSAGYHALAEIDCTRSEWDRALEHLEQSLRLNTEHLRARNLQALVLRTVGRAPEARALIEATQALDPLDGWAHHLRTDVFVGATQVRLDLALDYARSGFYREGLALLADANPALHDGTAPLLGYYRAWFCHRLNDRAGSRIHLKSAAKASPDYCFPARLEEIAILQHAIAANPRDARAPFYLGNLLYDRRRHREAITLWRRAVRLEPANAVAWRNLGLGYFNNLRRPVQARRAYDRAVRANPADARLVFERDQLWKRLGERPAARLRELARHPRLVAARDDLAAEYSALLNSLGRQAEALSLLQSRRFQPWEGGEGQALGQYVRAHLGLGRAGLARGDAATARAAFEAALSPPQNLGEAKHLLVNQSDLHLGLGDALAALGERAPAKLQWRLAANFRRDFQGMSVRAYSEMTYYSALAWGRLGQPARARRLLEQLQTYARALAKAPASVDYFATSLPTMLLFAEDLETRQKTTARFLEAQARAGLGDRAGARRILGLILARDPNHALALDLVSSLQCSLN